MDLILYYLGFKIFNFFQLKNIPKIIYFLIILFWYYYYLPYFKEDIESSQINLKDFQQLIITIFLISTLFRKIFSISIFAKKIFPDYSPINNFKKICFKIVLELSTIYFVHTVIFVSVLMSNIDFFSSIYVLKIFLSIIDGLILSWFFQLIPSFIFKRQSFLSYILLFLVFFPPIFGLFKIGLVNFYYEYIYLITIYLFLISYAFELIRIDNFGGKSMNNIIEEKSNFSFSAFFPYNNQLLISIIFNILVKVVMLLMISYQNNSGHLIPSFLIYMFLMPTSLFTYFLNNIWGFNRSYFINILLSSPNLRKLLLCQFKISILPLFFDFLLFGIFLSFNLKYFNNIYVLIFTYFSLLFSLFIFSFFWSLLYPKFINKVFSLDSPTTTSLFSSLATILLVLLSSLVEYSTFFIIIPGVMVVIASTLFFFINDYNLSSKFRMAYLKLFKY
jgi:hypothetical protein